MIITISGLPGSGKSTVGRLLAEKLGYKFYSMGDLRGQAATQRGMTIYQFEEASAKDPSLDRGTDNLQKKLGESEDNLVIDSWLGFHFIPQAVKIFLTIDPQRAGERVFQNPRPDEPAMQNTTEVQQMMQKRFNNFEIRIQKLYGISLQNQEAFDLVIDTSNLTPKEIVDTIIQTIQSSR